MTSQPRRIRVLRIYHSGVVTAYRQRERELRRLGVDVVLATARRWNEGGRDITLDQAGDDFVVAARTVGRHPYVFMYDPFVLVRLLWAGNFDLIDAHEEPASLAAAEIMLLRWLLQPSAKLAFYSAQNLFKVYPPPFRWIERIAIRTAASVHCCNEAAAKHLRSKGFRGHLRVLGLGVDGAVFRPSSTERLPGPLRVGYVGRIENRKGVQVLLASIIAVPEATLDFIGDGPDRKELEHEIARLDIGHRVQVRGFAPHAELPVLYQSLDVVCIPSLATPAWVEQFGRVAVEAMASGVPVVASNLGSLPEVVGDAGILVPPNDPSALAEALQRVAADPLLRSRMIVGGRARAARYSWSAIAEDHRGVYLEALA